MSDTMLSPEETPSAVLAALRASMRGRLPQGPCPVAVRCLTHEEWARDRHGDLIVVEVQQ